MSFPLSGALLISGTRHDRFLLGTEARRQRGPQRREQLRFSRQEGGTANLSRTRRERKQVARTSLPSTRRVSGEDGRHWKQPETLRVLDRGHMPGERSGPRRSLAFGWAPSGTALTEAGEQGQEAAPTALTSRPQLDTQALPGQVGVPGEPGGLRKPQASGPVPGLPSQAQRQEQTGPWVDFCTVAREAERTPHIGGDQQGPAAPRLLGSLGDTGGSGHQPHREEGHGGWHPHRGSAS